MKHNIKILMVLFCTLAGVNYSSGQNTYYGTDAGTGGFQNSNFGYNAGIVLTGNNNSFFGHFAGKKTTSGNLNFFGGSYSGYENTTGHSNTALGYYSGYYNTSGYANVFIGRQSGFKTTTGSANTFLGAYAGLNNTTGTLNVFIGGSTATGNTTGSQNVCIGYGSGQTIGAGIGNVFIGSYSGQYATGSGKLYIDNSSTSSPLIYGDFSTDIVAVNGRMGIGTTNVDPTIALKVNGTVVAKEVLVTVNNFPDFVFKKDYSLMPLKEVEAYIQKWSHLPSIPAEKQVLEDGLNLAEMNKLLLQKVEELTLYIIDQDKRIDDLEKKVNKRK